MKKTALILAATLFVSPIAAIAQDAEPAAEQASEEASDAEAGDEDRLICKRTTIVGSKFKKKICGTKEQWDEMAQRGTDAVKVMQTKRGFEPNG